MARLLIAYTSSEGQTAKIAEHIGEILRRRGHDVSVKPAGATTEAHFAAHDAVLVGGSLHRGRYQRELIDFVARHRARLKGLPGAFFSVSLAAASREARERKAAMDIAKAFLERSGWAPDGVASFAGALKYTRYGWLKRMLMRRIAAQEGGDTDTSRDHEYTDWDEVTRFAEAFSDHLSGRSRATGDVAE